MKVISSSPYAPFNSKEWNSLISKNAKFENTPIKIQKKFYGTFTGADRFSSSNANCIRIEKFTLTIFLLNIILRDPIFC